MGAVVVPGPGAGPGVPGLGVAGVPPLPPPLPFTVICVQHMQVEVSQLGYTLVLLSGREQGTKSRNGSVECLCGGKGTRVTIIVLFYSLMPLSMQKRARERYRDAHILAVDRGRDLATESGCSQCIKTSLANFMGTNSHQYETVVLFFAC